jgi:probable sporulation protein (polysaccharide deacetylase family)
MVYRYFSAIKGIKVFSIILVVCFLPAMFHGCGKYARRLSAVEKNVVFLDRDMGGLLREEVHAIVASQAERLRVPAVDATVDPETGGAVPGLHGYEVEVEQTVAAIFAAKRGEKVAPEFREIPADVTLSDFPKLAVYRGNPGKPQVTFLINVAWGNEYLDEMLKVLSDAGVGATFFLVGRWVRQNEELAQAIHNAGFELANHGDSDAASMKMLNVDAAREQIKKCADTIETVCGIRPVYFSPHRGEISGEVLEAATLENSRVIMWTVDTVDWQLPGVENMMKKILSQAGGGSLILMHPTEQTAEFLRLVIPSLRKQGLEPVTLSRLLSPSRFTEEGVNNP